MVEQNRDISAARPPQTDGGKDRQAAEIEESGQHVKYKVRINYTVALCLKPEC